MIKPNKPAKPALRRAKTADRAGTVEVKDLDEVAECSSPGTRRSLAELSTDELIELNKILAPVLLRGSEADALWSVWSKYGDYVAATVAGLVAAACRATIEETCAAWFRLRKMELAIEDIDGPLAFAGEAATLHPDETSEQALNRLVAEIGETDAKTLASVKRTWLRLADRNVHERLKRLRTCSEWSSPTGILHNHPPARCEALFHALLVSPPVYMEVRGDLEKIVGFRKEAIAFRAKMEAHEKEMREATNDEPARDRQGVPLSGLTREEDEKFRDSLDSICAGEVRTRYDKDDTGRISTVRLIAEHFRAFLNLSRTTAVERFGAAPWSTGIAALARAALGKKVTSEHVRGALKNWASD